MTSLKIKVIDEDGIHARPAKVVVEVASQFVSDLYIEHNTKKVNLKSIMMVLRLGISKGSEIILHADGVDEKEALNAIMKMGRTQNLFA